MRFLKDPSHWLFKLAPKEWIRAAMGEVRRAEDAYKRHDARAGLAGARRAAGMALNAALICEPNEAWGRTYIEHLRGLAESRDGLPRAVRDAAVTLIEAEAPGSNPLGVVSLRSHKADAKVLEAARDVMAHAYAVMVRNDGDAEHEEPSGVHAVERLEKEPS